MYSELVFQLDGNNINIDVTIMQCFAFGYHTNKISITNTTMSFCIISGLQYNQSTIITEKNCSVYGILEIILQCISDCYSLQRIKNYLPFPIHVLTIYCTLLLCL